MSEPEPVVKFTLREMFEKINSRLDTLERSAARQTTVRWAVALSLISGPGSVLLAHWIGH